MLAGNRCVWTLSEAGWSLSNAHSLTTYDFSLSLSLFQPLCLTHACRSTEEDWEVTRLRMQASWSGLLKNYGLDEGQEEVEIRQRGGGGKGEREIL